MSETSFVGELKKGTDVDPDDNVFASIWSEYERVIVESLITSFGLDFIIKDQEGGDVDTIFNVRNLKDENGRTIYKSKQNQTDYESRQEWDKKMSDSFYQDERYKRLNARVAGEKDRGLLVDSYTGKRVKRNEDIDLDHVVAKKEIYDDPGRALAGLDAKDLANCEDNLRPTSRSINRSMKDKDLDTYAELLNSTREERQAQIEELTSKKNLTDKERKQLAKLEKLEEADPELMKAENAHARKVYEAKITKEYYTSPKFAKDTAVAAGKRGAQMGLRQALGFIFTEIWFCAKAELQAMPAGSELKDMLVAVGHGIKKGLESAKEKYKELIAKVKEGVVAGALSSLTTTLCNIFFTTAKNLVRCIRQMYASVVQAGKVLLLNPDDLMLGDRIKTATVIIATGASVLVGTVAGELIGKTPVGAIPVIGDIVQVFCSTLVSGLLSCTLLIFLDRSKLINGIVNALNMIPSEVNNYKEIADVMERLAAKLSNIDIDLFRKETEQFSSAATQIAKCESDEELNEVLLATYKALDIKLPWEGDFDTFMGNKSNRLVFS